MSSSSAPEVLEIDAGEMLTVGIGDSFGEILGVIEMVGVGVFER